MPDGGRDLTHLSLFSGIGGLDLAAEWAGFRTVGQVEKDDYANKILGKHWPNVPRWEDIKDVTIHTVREAGIEHAPTVLSGGFPCQPFSCAGQRRGAEDDRYLWPEMLRVVQELRPAWVVGENVAGIISMALDDALADLERAGYACRAFVFPAAGVGAPHRRDRVFFVANSNDESNLETDTTSNPVRGGGNTRSGFSCGSIRQSPGDADIQMATAPWSADSAGRLWQSEPGVYGMANGLSERLDGNIMSNEPHILGLYADAEERRSGEVLQALWKSLGSEANQRAVGGSGNVHPPQLLRPGLYGCCDGEGHSDCRRAQMEGGATQGRPLRDMRNGGEVTGSPPERRYCGQRFSEPNDVVRVLSREMALGEWQNLAEEAIGLHHLWRACAQIGHVPETLSALQEVWQSLPYEDARWTILAARLGPWVEEWPNTSRVSSNSSARLDRLRCLGNAVVPQQAFPIFQAIAAIEMGAVV